jgi:hypothetical protein
LRRDNRARVVQGAGAIKSLPIFPLFTHALRERLNHFREPIQVNVCGPYRSAQKKLVELDLIEMRDDVWQVVAPRLNRLQK